MDQELKTNYELHEEVYQNLKSKGFLGWGGESYEERMLQWNKEISWLIEVYDKPKGKVLELGCGAGDASMILAKLGFEVTGIDISETAVDWAREKFADSDLEGKFLVRDVCASFDIGEEKFDMILDGNCLHCIIGEGRKIFFENIKKCLAEKGLVYISTLVGDPKNEIGRRGFDFQSRLQIQNGLALRQIPKLSQMKEELDLEDFKIINEHLWETPWWDHFGAILTVK